MRKKKKKKMLALIDSQFTHITNKSVFADTYLVVFSL